MPLTKISGNQINPATEAIITNLSFLAQTSVLTLPSGTEANRPTGMSYGTIRYNTDNDQAEIYVADSGQGSPGWTDVGGGGTGLGSNSVIRTNSNVIEENIDIDPNTLGAEYTNAFSAGPISIAQGYQVTVRSPANYYILGEDSATSSFTDLTVFGTLNTHNGMLDTAAIRENLRSYRAASTDNIISIDFDTAGATYVTNMSQDFTIDILNLPTTDISEGGADNNKAFGFTIMYYNGSSAIKPNGNITIDGGSQFSAQWQGGGAPQTSALQQNKYVVVGIALIRHTEIGATSNTTGWKAFIQFNEYGT